MSHEIHFPPDNPTDTSRISVPSDKNLSSNTDAAYRNSKVSTVNVISINPNDPGFPFRHYAIGIVKRAAKARIRVAEAGWDPATATALAPTVTSFILGNSIVDVLSLLERFMCYLYDQYAIGTLTLPYHPRNLGFAINALATNRVYGTGNQMVVERFAFVYTISAAEIQKVSTFFRVDELAYDLVNVMAVESGAFTTFQPKQHNATAKFVKLTMANIGSTFVFGKYDNVSNEYQLLDYTILYDEQAVWWFKASVALSLDSTTIPAPTVTSVQTYSGIGAPIAAIQEMLMYQDMFQDVPYVVTTEFDFDVQASTLAPYDYIIDVVNEIWSTIPELNFAGAPPKPAFFTDGGLQLSQALQLINCIYSPFWLMDPRVTDDSRLDGDYRRMVWMCGFKGPLYFPSVLVESLAIHTDSVVTKVTNAGISRTIQFLNICRYPTTATGTGFSISDLYTLVGDLLDLMKYRRYLKMNFVPETRPDKALYPYFVLNAAAIRDSANVNLYISPYQERYIDENNLQILATCMIWPTIVFASNDLITTFTILLSADTNWTQITTRESDLILRTIGNLMLDASYGSDGCEMDAYFNKVRHSYLGFWSALMGLIPKAISVGTNLIKGILSPGSGNKVGNIIGHAVSHAPAAMQLLGVDNPSVMRYLEMAKMHQAGIKSLQLSTVGPPSDGLTLTIPAPKEVTTLSEPIGKISHHQERVIKVD